jgi:xanthine dehydrogenase accessory factor
MNDFQEIISRVRRAPEDFTEAVVATIVRTVGSSYRGPGARALLEPDGTVTGVLSGGCLEADLLERAKHVRAHQKPDLVTYDTSSPEEIVDGLGIGCNGKVQILLEPWAAAEESLRYASTLLEEERRGVVATVFHVRGFPNVSWGARACIDETQAIFRSLLDQNLQQHILARSRSLLNSHAPVVESLQLGVEIADVLFEIVSPVPLLCIFGAGPGSAALARMAKALGWRVFLADHRDKASYAHDFDFIDKRVVGDFSVIASSVDLKPSMAAVVMSHNFAADLEYLKILLPSPVHYIGLLGSRSRSAELFAALAKEGIPTTPSMHERLFNPVGLDIGAEGPEEIALAILSEIRAALSGRSGGFLKNRKGPIHERGTPQSAH